MNRQFPARRERRNPQGFGDAARLGEIRLQNGDCTVFDHAIELEARVVVFTGRERQPPVAGGLPVRHVVMRGKRFFEPADFQFIERRHCCTGIGDRITGIRVGKDHKFIAEGFSHRRDALDVARTCGRASSASDLGS